MRYFIFSLRVLLTAGICSSLISCSLFRPKENDDDTWGDPNWKIGEGGTASTNKSSVGLATALPGKGEPDDRHLASLTPETDYWPTTQELEARGGSLSVEHYQEAERALHSSNGTFVATTQTDELNAFKEPQLPQPSDGADPLAGFWDEEDDYTDATIQRAGAPQEDPFLAGSPAPEASSDIELDESTTAAQKDEMPPVIMPIPPSSTPSRSGSMISTSQPAVSRVPSEPEPAQQLEVADTKVPDVVLLDATTTVTDAAFEGVSLINSGATPSIERSEEGSFLDRRKRVSLSDVGATSDGPLMAPSIEEAAGDL
ncbi:MAG: hypothetical protein R3F19_03020 [Verrucomicrobiales bacterium]